MLRAKNFINKIMFYEEPQNTPFTEVGSFVPNYYVDISDVIQKKMKALRLYKSEQKKFPHPRSPNSLKLASAQRGSAIGVKFAEAFMIWREIDK